MGKSTVSEPTDQNKNIKVMVFIPTRPTAIKLNF